jgi:hypothetical protein
MAGQNPADWRTRHIRAIGVLPEVLEALRSRAGDTGDVRPVGYMLNVTDTDGRVVGSVNILHGTIVAVSWIEALVSEEEFWTIAGPQFGVTRPAEQDDADR